MGDRLERGLNMSFDKAARIISYSRRLGGQYITFLGGEPTLNPALPRMVDHAISEGFTQIMINSNGIASRTLEKIAPEKLHYISFSLDGATAKTHDSIRGEGMFAKTTASIRKAVLAGYAVRLIGTISKMNIHEADDILQFADDVGVGMVNFHVFSEEGNGIDHPDWSLLPEEWIAFYKYLETVKQNYRTSIWYPPTYATEDDLQRYVGEGYNGCVGHTLDRLSIFPDGRSYVCSVLFDKPLHFGEMKQDGLKLKRGPNEFELFTEASYRAEAPWLTGCPAEQVLMANGKAANPDNIISVRRLWKSQA